MKRVINNMHNVLKTEIMNEREIYDGEKENEKKTCGRKRESEEVSEVVEKKNEGISLSF